MKVVSGVGNIAGTLGTVGATLAVGAATGATVSAVTKGAIVAAALQRMEALGGGILLDTFVITPARNAFQAGEIAKAAELLLGPGEEAIANAISFMTGWKTSMTAGGTVNNGLNTITKGIGSTFIQWEGKFVMGEEEAKALSQNITLTELDLSDTGITSDIVSILLQSPSLMSVNLSWNNLDDHDALKIANILIRENRTMTEINLQNNNINQIVQLLIDSSLKINREGNNT
jgi:hypothetical protein